MKQIIQLVLFSILLSSCTQDSKSMLVDVKINDFQKGTVYLERIKDTLLIKVDSITLDGTNKFQLSDNIESPQIYFLSIAGTDKILNFFGEKGTISVLSDLEKFNYNAKITGSKNQEFLNVYKETNAKFNNLRLDLIKEKFDVLKEGNQSEAIEIEKKIKNIQRRKYLYTVNFAVNHADFEVAPYLALSEIHDINPKLLDTIISSLTPSVKESVYGKKLIEYSAKK